MGSMKLAVRTSQFQRRTPCCPQDCGRDL